MDVEQLIAALRMGQAASGGAEALKGRVGATYPQPAMSPYERVMSEEEKRKMGMGGMGSANSMNAASLREAM